MARAMRLENVVEKLERLRTALDARACDLADSGYVVEVNMLEEARIRTSSLISILEDLMRRNSRTSRDATWQEDI